MTPQLAIQVVSEALMAAFWISAPLLAIAFVLGLFINLIQIATSMQDQVFSIVPRLAAVLAGLLFLFPWMLHRASDFTIAIMHDLPKYAR